MNMHPYTDAPALIGRSQDDRASRHAHTAGLGVVRVPDTATVFQGMDVGRSELVLHVRVCEGLMRQLDGTVEKRFAKKETLYPLQVC